ncbi:MAG: DUF1295 domain-containing protein [Treponema sp.]|nr:DUF1295 domain-containing protein [Treponema sp.]
MHYLILALVSLAVTAIGFAYYIHFFSVGYGFAISGISLALFILFFPILTLPNVIITMLLFLYGLRLGGYLLYREIKTPAYNKRVGGEIKDKKSVSIGSKILLWLSCAILYLCMTSPVLFRMEWGPLMSWDVCTIIGIVLMVTGITFEVLADYQKSTAKKKTPGRFVDTGLYRFVRCPNYLGEILLWTGVFLCGCPAMRGWQWIVAVIGLLLIYYVMFSGARRLELRQNKSYGEDPEYQNYVKKVPIILPFIPLYSVVKYKFLVA